MSNFGLEKRNKTICQYLAIYQIPFSDYIKMDRKSIERKTK